MADAANGAAEDVLAKEEEEVVVEEAVSAEEFVEGGVAEKVDAVQESVEVTGAEEVVTVPDGDCLAAEVKEREVAVEEVVAEEVALETAAMPVEDGEVVPVSDPVAVEESSETAYVVAKQMEEASLLTTPEVEIPESTGIPVSSRSPTSWTSCCGLFDVLRRS